MQLSGELLKAGRDRNLPSQGTQAIAQQVLQAGQRKLAQGPHERCFTLCNQLPVVRGKLIEQTGRFSEVACCLSQRSFSRWEALTYRGQRLMAKIISGQRCIDIALVVDPRQTFVQRIALDFSPGNIQQRPQQTQPAKTTLNRHSRRAGNAGPAQQVEQYGFGLIAAMLRQQKTITETIGKSRISGGTGSCFQTKPGRHINRDMASHQPDAKPLAIPCTEFRPGIGIGRQPMMDVNGRDLAEAETAQNMEKDNRVTTAGQPYPKAGIRLETGGEKSAYPFPKIS